MSSAEKIFPSGTSEYHSGGLSLKADVSLDFQTMRAFNTAKEIMNTSYYTKVDEKRHYRLSMLTVEEKLVAVTKDYESLYDTYQTLHDKHQLLYGATTALVEEVEENHKLNTAKMALLLQICGATDMADLPVFAARPAFVDEPVVDEKDTATAPGTPFANPRSTTVPLPGKEGENGVAEHTLCVKQETAAEDVKKEMQEKAIPVKQEIPAEEVKEEAKDEVKEEEEEVVTFNNLIQAFEDANKV